MTNIINLQIPDNYDFNYYDFKKRTVGEFILLFIIILIQLGILCILFFFFYRRELIFLYGKYFKKKQSLTFQEKKKINNEIDNFNKLLQAKMECVYGELRINIPDYFGSDITITGKRLSDEPILCSEDYLDIEVDKTYDPKDMKNPNNKALYTNDPMSNPNLRINNITKFPIIKNI